MHTRSLENCKDFSYLQSSNRDTDKENKHMDTKVRRRCGMNWETGIDMYTLLTLCTEKAMAAHSSTLAWKIPQTEELGRLQSMRLLRVGHEWATFTFHFPALEKEMATHSSVLAWRIPGTGEPGGPPSMGSHRVGHDWSDSAAAADTMYKTENTRTYSIAQELSSGLRGDLN